MSTPDRLLKSFAERPMNSISHVDSRDVTDDFIFIVVVDETQLAAFFEPRGTYPSNYTSYLNFSCLWLRVVVGHHQCFWCACDRPCVRGGWGLGS